MNAVAEKTQMTPEDLLGLAGSRRTFELVDGELVERKPKCVTFELGWEQSLQQ